MKQKKQWEQMKIRKMKPKNKRELLFILNL